MNARSNSRNKGTVQIFVRVFGSVLKEFLSIRVLIIFLAAAVMLGDVGRNTYQTIQNSAESQVREWLDSTLDAEMSKVSIWFEVERSIVTRFASQYAVEELVEEIDQGGNQSSIERLREILNVVGAGARFTDFFLVLPSGSVFGSALENASVSDVPGLSKSLLEGVMGGQTVVGESYASERGAKGAAFLIGSPVYGSEGRPIAALYFEIDPAHRFPKILASFGERAIGETVVYDRDGAVLAAGGGNSFSEYVFGFQDLKGGGVDIDGYTSYRGESVVAAWTWLPDYNVGIVREIRSEEAFRSLEVLVESFALLFSLLVFTGMGVMLVSYTLVMVQRRARKAIARARQLGQYNLESCIAKGGMGEVYRAQHSLLRRPTAIKLIRSDLTSEIVLEQFEREVKLTSQLRHPNTIEIYDYGRTPEKVFYYAMEYLDGFNLKELTRLCGVQTPARVIHILSQVCGSLEEAHSVGLIHRDIKPANIMLCKLGGLFDVVKVLDFGLVKPYSEKAGGGYVMGTLQVLAPESLLSPGREDVRSDIYSLGVLGHYLLSGRYLFDASNAQAYKDFFNGGGASSVAGVFEGVPKDLADILALCLSVDPSKRPASVALIREALSNCRDVVGWGPREARDWWKLQGTAALRHAVSQAEVPMPVSEDESLVVPLRDVNDPTKTGILGDG